MGEYQSLQTMGEYQSLQTMGEYQFLQTMGEYQSLQTMGEYQSLQTMGLVLLQELFRHERRLNQLFCKLGGAPLLESMLSQGNVRLRPVVVQTLSMLSGVHQPVVVQTLSMLSGEGTPPMVRTRRSSSSTSVCDIWDQIRERWLMEDKVSQMLNSRSCKDTRPDEIS
ncbi:hypothetical protein LSAT2_006263 [Lamellibrachia satsuma]|nr:hypothetical protein LSAT2_006263 [Lamellibrachia satsuma]